MRWFILFLTMSCIFCLYGSYLLWGCLSGIAKEKGIFRRDLLVRKGRDGIVMRANLAIRIALIIRESYFLAPLFVFALLMGLVLVGFIGFQFYHILRNVTTAETFKVDDLVSIAKFRQKMKSKKGSKEMDEETMDEEEAEYRRQLRYSDLPIISLPYKHAYSKGPWRNFVEMCFPPSLYPPKTNGSKSGKKTKKN